MAARTAPSMLLKSPVHWNPISRRSRRPRCSRHCIATRARARPTFPYGGEGDGGGGLGLGGGDVGLGEGLGDGGGGEGDSGGGLGFGGGGVGDTLATARAVLAGWARAAADSATAAAH